MMRTGKFLAVLVIITLLMGFPVFADTTQDSTVVGGEYTLEPGEKLLNDLTVFAGSAFIAEGSTVEGSVTVVGGSVVIGGTISGDVVAFGGQVELLSTAVVEGDLIGLGNVIEATGASVAGERLELPLNWMPPSVEGATEATRTSNVFGSFLAFALVLGLSLLAVLIAPIAVDETNFVMTTDWIASIGIGALTVVLVIVLAILFGILSLVCIGLPLLLVLGIAVVAGGVFGWASTSRWVGRRLARLLSLSSMTRVKETLLGAALLGLLSFIPCLGPIIVLVAEAWGVGALLITRVDALQQLRTASHESSSVSDSVAHGDTQKLFESDLDELGDEEGGFTSLLADLEDELLDEEEDFLDEGGDSDEKPADSEMTPPTD